MSTKRVLLIGGNSYLAKAFTSKCDDRLNITALHRGEKIGDYFELNESFFAGFDVVINFAAIVHQRHPDTALAQKVNAELPTYLATLAKRAGVEQFIQMSTIAVYGNAQYISSQSVPNPDTAYGATKLEADCSVVALGDASFIVTLVRPTVVYGLNAPGNMQALMKLIAVDFPLPFAYGANRRSILYVGNLVNALERIIERKHKGVFLLCDKKSLSLQQIAEALREGLGISTRFFSLPQWLILLLCSIRWLPFYKLYGDMIVDDSHSVELLGEYAKIDSEVALREVAKGERK